MSVTEAQQELIDRMYNIVDQIEGIRHALDDMTNPLPYASAEQKALMRSGTWVRQAERLIETAIEDMPGGES